MAHADWIVQVHELPWQELALQRLTDPVRERGLTSWGMRGELTGRQDNGRKTSHHKTHIKMNSSLIRQGGRGHSPGVTEVSSKRALSSVGCKY